MKQTLSISLLFFFLFLACAENLQEEKPALTLIPENLSPEQQIYADKGLAAQQETAEVLFNQLSKAMEGGPNAALQTCNLTASPMARNLSKKHNAGIRRTSSRPRNTINTPTEFEKKILLAYQEKHDAGEQIQARVEIMPHEVAYYAPIYVQGQCLQCHGEIGETLDENFYQNIKELYPNDKAHGFNSGDLRGIWSITFPRETMK